MKISLRDLSHARYFQRELTHADYNPVWLKSR